MRYVKDTTCMRKIIIASKFWSEAMDRKDYMETYA
jgi:hypothetical protein